MEEYSIRIYEESGRVMFFRCDYYTLDRSRLFNNRHILLTLYNKKGIIAEFNMANIQGYQVTKIEEE